jgi:hypothetical protein
MVAGLRSADDRLTAFLNYTRRFILNLIRAENSMKYWEVIADNLSNAG